MIYIGSPYTHPEPAVQVLRYHAVLRYTVSLMETGAICFSPIVYGHPFHALAGVPGVFEYWQRFNESMLIRSHTLQVLCLDGWRESVGLREEIEFADDNGIEVRYVQP